MTRIPAQSTEAAFDGWAEYYDLIHDGLPGDVEFYVEEALCAGGDTLEIGVGTGRIAIPAALAGVSVVGLDDSRAMLNICRERIRRLGLLPGRVTLAQGDMRRFDLGHVFTLAIMPYRAFMHALTPEDQRECLLAVRRHLPKGGRVILDTWNPSVGLIHSLAAQGNRSRAKLAGRYTIGRRNMELLHYARLRCDPFAQLLVEEHLLKEVDSKGSVCRELKLPLVRAWTWPREFRHMALSCGFDVKGVYGGFDRSELRESSTEMVWFLERA